MAPGRMWDVSLGETYTEVKGPGRANLASKSRGPGPIWRRVPGSRGPGPRGRG